MSLQPMQLSVESESTSSQRTQPICKICQGNHGFRFCPNTVCGLCQKKGHIKRDCLLFKCSKCRRQGHNRQECGKQCFRCHEYHVNTTICPPIEERKKSPKEIKEIQQKEKECNYCHQKGHIEYYCETKEIYQKNLNIECGCSEGMIYCKRRNYGNNKTKFHCDKCHMPNEESKIDIVTELGGRKKLYCHEYGSLVANAEFQERILNDDEDIFMEDADAFREAMVQKAHEQNQDLINLMENETIGLYHSHLLEPEKKEPPRKRARSADSRLEKNYAPIINISINK
ncbi:hypothetical protein F8M41_014247 [Gigaspora margarita]|uniref:CCHC-type domain-containing protein n=1 Tax=Gigaspora margarita TaxID=4874 RepID=A0A8H4A0U3_GIGMA|nr:hypothetical protein F8M41_014247 [Gigaspora margarita]